MTSFLLVLALVQPVPTPPSVLVLTLDTFRGDHLGEQTPNLSQLAARGVTFSRARSPVPLTLPSHVSLFTGLYPPEHGVRDNGRFVLGKEPATLAQRLRAAGYETAAFVGSFVLDRRFGLARGFDHYDDDVQSKADESALESPEAERSGDAVVTAFEQWLAERASTRPFFAWVHLYDPHAPYEPPPPYPATYDGEIAFTDSLVGRILARLPASALVAVVGDHGEGLGEHSEMTHALFIYNTTLHVPFILAGPGVAEGRRVERLARTIDLPATLLDYLGLATRFGRGESLRPLVAGETAKLEASREAYSESLYGADHFGFAPLFGLETERFRFIDAPRRELYELGSDPKETRDLLVDEPAAARELHKRLQELREGFSSTEETSTSIDDETRARLESLGYITTATSAAPDDRRDPKDEIDIYNRVQLAQAQRARGRCAEVVSSLTPLVATNDYPVAVAYETLGACLLEAGELPKARALFEQALSRGLESAGFHVELGVIAQRGGDLAGAEKELRVALGLEPWNVSAHYHLANTLRAGRRDPEAVAAYEEAIRLNPSYVFAWNGLGMTRSRLGENEEALEAFRRVVALRPDEPRGHFNLAVQLERMGQKSEALPIYRHFLAIAPEAAFPRERERALAAIR